MNHHITYHITVNGHKHKVSLWTWIPFMFTMLLGVACLAGLIISFITGAGFVLSSVAGLIVYLIGNVRFNQ